MSAPTIAVAPTFGRRVSRTQAFTLLETLVALGVIIGALAGIAALLPATSARLAEATLVDRAGTMAANARAEIASRGLTSATLWSGVSAPAIVFGEGLTSGGTSAVTHTTIAAANQTAVSTRIDPTAGFQLRDALLTTGTGIVTGYAPGVCYGCMLSSTAAASAGAQVRMTTVVFRKPAPQVQSFTLTQTGTGSTVLTSGSGVAAAADRARLLPSCSWILAVRAGQEPRWVQIASSWTAYGPGQTTGSGTGASYVSLSSGTTDWGNLLTSGTVLQAFGFEGLLRVDERFVNLQ